MTGETTNVPTNTPLVSSWQPIFWDFVERAGWSAGQEFAAVLLTTGAVGEVIQLPWSLAVVMAAGAGVVSLVATAIQYLTKQTNLAFWPDLLVRLLKTFLASMLAAFGADAFNVLTFNWTAALNIAVVATLGALAKGILARQAPSIGQSDGNNPSTLPPALYKAAQDSSTR